MTSPTMRAPGGPSRTEEIKEPSFTMTASHLARTMEATRHRERQKIARLLDDRADLILAQGNVDAAAEVRTLAEEVRSIAQQSIPMPETSTDPIEVLYRDGSAAVPVVGTQDDSGLPPVRHMDDFDEGRAMVRNLGARGKLNLPRD